MGCSNDNYWKLDKWDKIGIATLIVFFTIFVVLNTFCFGADTFVPVNDLVQNTVDNVIILQEHEGRFGFAIDIKRGHTYKFTNNMQNNIIHISFPKEFPAVGYRFVKVLNYVV